jgi:hypothetical protein
MKFSTEVLRESVLDCSSWEEKGIEFVEASDWYGDGKYQYCNYIFKYDGKYYSVKDERTGSYYTEYSYASRDWWKDEIECPEVEKQEVVTYKWVKVKS